MVHVCTFDHPPKFPVVSKTTIWRFADSAGTRNQFFHSTHDFSLLFSKIWQYKLIVYFIPFYRVPTRVRSTCANAQRTIIYAINEQQKSLCATEQPFIFSAERPLNFWGKSSVVNADFCARCSFMFFIEKPLIFLLKDRLHCVMHNTWSSVLAAARPFSKCNTR